MQGETNSNNRMCNKLQLELKWAKRRVRMNPMVLQFLENKHVRFHVHLMLYSLNSSTW